MKKHTLGYYMEKAGGSLMPSDTMLRGISNSDWWTVLSDYFDDLIWQYWPERQIFINDKFNIEDEAGTIANIKRAFAINLKSKAYKYKRLYDISKAEYNPLYNVDGEEITERVLKQEGEGAHELSGTDTNTTSGSEETEKGGKETNTRSGSESEAKAGKETNTRSGSETFEKAGTESNVKSGSESMEKAGTEKNVKSGSEELEKSGDNTTTDSNTTYDSATFYDTNKRVDSPDETDTTTYNNVTDELSFTDREDTTTYNNVTDELSFTDREDTTTYNDVKDELSFTNREDTHTYNNVKDELSFQSRKDTHTYNDVQNETEYGRTDTETRDFVDTETIHHKRFGNIGIIMSQQMLEAENRFWGGSFDWMKYVVRECVNCVSYALFL